ncbi:hypothetical protein EZJ49_01855 [Bdellovibrio bacteriovorus]|uniref:hypothetical protein n=1 Tax=Bdellovibrio bacteriovorus TaxID=959 RepID=UPI0021D25F74|nr:hypothetical protein [Bdellovibrio bacteriovorus]UXR64993.1 hypothetical protein EZJ49_01855 [Bdellovibrio bacteriovorus]
MPEIKDYDGKKKHHHSKKRRPHHEAQTEEIMAEAEEIQAEAAVTMDEAQEINTEAQNEGVTIDETVLEAKKMVSEGAPIFDEDTQNFSRSEDEPQKVHLDFYGSEMIRQKAPKVMELADSVADEWVKDGQFEGLPVGNPLAQVAAAKALRKAKDVEKKLEEKGVFAMAKMGIDLIKSKIDKRNH